MIPLVNTKWYDIGLQLLDPKYENELNTIETDTRNDAATCCRKMFNKWFNTDGLANWDKLMKALRMVQLHCAAGDIEKLLLQGELLIYVLCVWVTAVMQNPLRNCKSCCGNKIL